MNFLFIIKVKILVFTKWSYSPVHTITSLFITQKNFGTKPIQRFWDFQFWFISSDKLNMSWQKPYLEQDACHSALEWLPVVSCASCALVGPAALTSGWREQFASWASVLCNKLWRTLGFAPQAFATLHNVHKKPSSNNTGPCQKVPLFLALLRS